MKAKTSLITIEDRHEEDLILGWPLTPTPDILLVLNQQRNVIQLSKLPACEFFPERYHGSRVKRELIDLCRKR